MELEKLKGSHKVYRAHLTRIYGKIEELNLTESPATEETFSLVIRLICRPVGPQGRVTAAV